MPEKMLIFPFGGNGREALMSVLAVNRAGRRWDVIGFVDDDKAVAGRECCGVKVVGGSHTFTRYSDAKVIAVPGNPANYLKRKAIIDGLGLGPGRYATVIDPSAVVAPDARIGKNTVLMNNVVVSCGASVGDHCVVLPNTVISHDSSVGDYCCVGSNVSVSGGVRIGPAAYIGSGARIKEGISIGERSLVGLGSVVIRDVAGMTVVAGNPARLIREATE
jgi:sugar O-acyltransferase (sialic acid O-acetyltransferase NeuD family)